MKMRFARRLMAVAGLSLLLATGASAPSVAAPPCDHPQVCEWILDCFYADEDGNIVLSCRLRKVCEC